MRDLEKYKGVIPAFYACYDNEGKLNIDGVKKLTKYFIESGVKGVYVGGSSGECIYLSKDERKATLEAIMEEAKGKLTVIAHVACNNTSDSMELASHAECLGVDAIAAIPPIYFRLPEHAIAKYWNDISSAAPNTDFIIYNIPQLAGVALTPTLYKEMLKNKNVIGVKNSSMPIQDIQIFKEIGGENTIVFNGPDEQFIGGFMIGAEGGIGGTYGAMPKLFLKALEFFEKGNHKVAKAIQYDINKIITELCSCKGNMYAVIKGTLKINHQLDIGGVRSPLVSLVEEDISKVEAVAKLIRDTEAKYL